MASTITITCPECDKQLRASSELVGKKIKCKACDATFTARDPESKPAASKPAAGKPAAGKPAAGKPAAKPAAKDAAKKKTDPDDDNTPYGVTEEYLGRRCPDCANPMEEEDLICLHCGYNTRTREKARMRKLEEVTPLGHFLWLLPGIAAALGAVLIVTLDALYIFMLTEESLGNPETDWAPMLAHKFPKIYVSLFCISLVSTLTWYAIRRLVFHPTPPEVEIHVK